MSATDPPPTSLKEQLEIIKLKKEIRSFDRAFYAQIANTICIFILGLAVLLFYQWPQLQQTEAARISAEELQVAKLVEDAQGIPDPGRKAQMLEAIARRWPQHKFVADIASTQQTGQHVVEARVPDKTTTSSAPPSSAQNEIVRKECDVLQRNLAELKNSVDKLTRDLDLEERVGNVLTLPDIRSSLRGPGRGPAYRAIQTQRDAAASQLREGQANYDKNCRVL